MQPARARHSARSVIHDYAKLHILYTLAGLVMAHSVLVLPLVMIVTSSSPKRYDMNQEHAARSLGAPRWKVF